MTASGMRSSKLVFTASCPTCGELQPVKGSSTCPVCKVLLHVDEVATVRQAIGKRRQAFKVRLSRLAKRVHEVTDGPLEFKSRGLPLSSEEYFTEVLTPTKEATVSLNETVEHLLNSQDWDPDQSDCIAAFTRFMQLLDDALVSITTLQAIMPPLDWRAVHRELTRSVALGVRGNVFMALTISAVDADEAAKVQANSSLAFAKAREHLERANGFIDLASRLPADGPFQMDGSLDVAALTWSSIGRESTTIAQGAEIARKAFAQIPGASTLPDERALMLLPALALGARAVDHTMVVELAKSLRETLDSSGNSSWVIDPMLLVKRTSRGLDLILEYSERLGREWRYGLPRHHIMRTLTEGYRELVEGALIDVGAPIIIAGRVSHGESNATYEEDVVDGIKAGEAIDELEGLVPLSRGSVEMTFRNASAHAGIEVTENGVIAKARRSEDGRVVSRKEIPLSDAEFFEELVELQELLFALQMAVLLWLWANPDSRVKKAATEENPTTRQRNQTLSLLGGLAGLHNVRLITSGGNATISAEQLTETIKNPNEISILSLVPATFGLSPDIKQVTLHILDRTAATFTRDEFMDTQSDLLHKEVLLGLFTTKWLLMSNGLWTDQNEAAYVTFPLTKFLFDLGRLIIQQPYKEDYIQQAVKSWKSAHARLDQVLPVEQRGSLTEQVVRQLNTFCTAIDGLAISKRLDLRTEAERYATQARAALTATYDIQQQALILRDAGKE